MSEKSTLSLSPEAGLTFAETIVGIAIFGLLLSITIFFLQNLRESTKIDRTFGAIYSLKEEIKKANHAEGSYTRGPMLPLLFASRAFPNTLDVDYDRRRVTTPMGHPLDITGRGAHFSIDLYNMTPNECYDFGQQIVTGNYLMLGNTGDDFSSMKIGNMVFSDAKPLTTELLKEACTHRFSVDVFMAFR